ncbi:hypothetical protein D5086_030389 [Populus alba]|uniref:Uncharacterized protein n=2 Tax=Populus TaxID=3689 RepID=A0ACC4APS2_POPAL|nr:hypothetical protein POTOM_053639 [Populus tomentosa]
MKGLRSKFHHVNDSGPTPSYSTTDSNKDTVIESSNSSSLEVSDSDPEYVVEDPEIHFDNTNSDTERLNKIVDEMMSTEECKMKLKTKTEIGENQMDKKATDFCQVEDNRTYMNDNGIAKAIARAFSEGGSYEWENIWYELKFQITNLKEENLRQQAELARRNIEKRLVIDKLRLELEHFEGSEQLGDKLSATYLAAFLIEQLEVIAVPTSRVESSKNSLLEHSLSSVP